MDWPTARARFLFLAEAFDGTGGFAPRVRWEDETVTVKSSTSETPLTATRRVPKLAAPCHLVQYTRESAEKYAARCAVAYYENHFREACERFASFLARRRPMRTDADGPLAALLVENADLRGSSLNEFVATLALYLKARGTMFVLMDRPPSMDGRPATLLQQTQRRAVPFVQMVLPEVVEALEADPLTGELRVFKMAVKEVIDGREQHATRVWTDTEWSLQIGDRVIDSGPHGFGRCPVLAVTESGDTAPVVGKFAQIADISRRLYNARSERDELLRSQTFSVLTLQVPEGSTTTPAEAVATVGTHSVLVHQGITPAYVAPDSGPAETYAQVIAELQDSMRRLGMEDSPDQKATPESGLARKLRFEKLNAELAATAQRLQGLERRIWELFHAGLGTNNSVSVEYPTDFNLVDSIAELDVLETMQRTGFPDEALRLKMKTVAAAEFDAADEGDKDAVMDAIDQVVQAGVIEPEIDPQTGEPIVPGQAAPAAAPAPAPAPQPVDITPLAGRLDAVSAVVSTLAQQVQQLLQVQQAPAATPPAAPAPELASLMAQVAGLAAKLDEALARAPAAIQTIEVPAPAKPAPAPRVISLLRNAEGQITAATVSAA